MPFDGPCPSHTQFEVYRDGNVVRSYVRPPAGKGSFSELAVGEALGDITKVGESVTRLLNQ